MADFTIFEIKKCRLVPSFYKANQQRARLELGQALHYVHPHKTKLPSTNLGTLVKFQVPLLILHFKIRNIDLYSKRCTFGERKNLCSSKFVQLSFVDRVKVRWSENRAAQGFHYINSFISNIFGPNSKTYTCEVGAAWGHMSRGLTVSAFILDW